MARLLLDTHVLVWLPSGDPRLGTRAAAAILDPDHELYVSAVTAFELTDLQQRGRLEITEGVDFLAQALGFTIIGFPAECWAMARSLPDIHRDPVDRMLIAHSMHGDFTLLTADLKIRQYPIKTLW